MAIWHSPNADIQFTMSDPNVILNEFKKFSDKEQKKAATAAARKGMRLVVKAAKKEARQIDRSGTEEKIWKNITAQNAPRQGRRVGGVVIRVGVKGGARKYSNTKENVRKGRVGKKYKTLGSSGNPGGDTWYWRFVEFGTARSRARPFLQRALAANVTSVTNVTVGEMKIQLDKIFTKRSNSA